MEQITKEVEHHKAHKVYKELICQNTEGHDAVSKPRNVKQLQNARAKVQNDSRLTKDTIVNTHELAYAHPNFIWHITTLPDLTVICGEQEMLELLQELVNSKDRQLILSYDTTFSLGEFYVSPLLFRNVYFNSNPVMPALFLIHERKLQSTHETLFSFLESRLKKLKGFPIITDMETGIVNAIETRTKMRVLGCWRHLRKDVERWLQDHVEKSRRSRYVDDLLQIMRSETEEEYITILRRKQCEWEETFANYFDKYISPKMKYFVVYAIKDACHTLDKVNGITTNSSEGFNFLIKDFQEWKEAPLDTIAMNFKCFRAITWRKQGEGSLELGNMSCAKSIRGLYPMSWNFHKENWYAIQKTL